VGEGEKRDREGSLLDSSRVDLGQLFEIGGFIQIERNEIDRTFLGLLPIGRGDQGHDGEGIRGVDPFKALAPDHGRMDLRFPSGGEAEKVVNPTFPDALIENPFRDIAGVPERRGQGSLRENNSEIGLTR